MGSFTDLFIRRPVLATVVSLLILLVGLAAGFRLQIRQYPELEQTTITITTNYPGANADLIKGFITNCTIGDWFVLYQMSKNLNRKFFHDFLIQLSKDVKNM